MRSTALLTLLACLSAASAQEFPQATVNPCAGDTRGDQRCNHDSTHRVCAEIGDAHTSFFSFTGQPNWCGTIGHYGGEHGEEPRCPPDHPTWCICKWATARWISGQGCDASVNIDCDATDICSTIDGLFFSYQDFSVNLQPAHDCIKQKCSAIWNECEARNPSYATSQTTAGGRLRGR
jgi:hypothetical protein